MRILLILFFTFLFSAAYADSIADGIKAIIAKAPSNVNIGIKVQSMDTGKVLYSLNSDRYFTPASTQKTLTAAAALYFLGKNFAYKTAIYATNKPYNNGILNGDVYIKFMGDPTLTSDDLIDLIAQVKNQGIKKITGHVYLDNSFFDEKAYGSGWMWDDQNDCYSAPLNAIIINHNCFDVNLVAGSHVGAKAKIQGDEDLQYTPVISDVITRKFTSEDNECILDVSSDDQNHYFLTGCVTPDSPTQTLSFAIRYVKPFAKQLISDLFTEAHITVGKGVSFAITSVSANVIATHYSAPLPELINTMLKKSDNLIADALFKTLGAMYSRQQGNWTNGAQAVTAILDEQAGVDLTDDEIVDGAGLSRYNLIRPDDFSKLLNSVYHNTEIGGDFIDGLPIAGIDGTLKNKAPGKNNILRSNIQAKTGTMTGVLSLVGFVYTQQHHILSFVIMINNFPGKVYPYFFLEMQIAEYLIRNE